jgi:signal peptidase II
MIAGGAVGNLIDRVYFGEVIDFLDFHLYHKKHWPAFNLADSFISIGVFILMLTIFLKNEKK